MTKLLPLVLTALVLVATPAWAHEEINPPTVPTGKPVFLSLSAANEKRAAITKVTLTAPAGTPFGEAVRSPAGWTAAKTEGAITWSGGSIAPEAFETFGFELEGPDQPGSLQYKVALGFADGSTENATVPLTVVAAGSSTATTAGSGGTTVTTVAPDDTTATTAASGTKKKAGSTKRANVALGLGAAALAISVIALVQSRRRGRPTQDAQDW